MARTDMQVGRPDLDVACDPELARNAAEPRQRGVQRFLWRATHGPEPWIVDPAIDEKVGPHRVTDREYRSIGNPVVRWFTEVG